MAAEDVRVLIPQTRRALDGPFADSPEAATAKLSDSQITAVIADAIAAVILYTHGAFGHELVAVEVDETYNAPSEWAIDPALSEPEKVVITTQAALDYLLAGLGTLKVAETIRDEGAEWSYQLSAQALVEHIRHLQKVRDEALEEVRAMEPSQVAFYSYISERDQFTAALIEPYYVGELR